MTKRALKPCAIRGCPYTTEFGKRYCDEHMQSQPRAPRSHDERRESAARRGYDARWRRLRVMFLRAHPLCADPFGDHRRVGAVEVATDVDHIVPLSRGGTNDSRNLQALCHSCHSRKTRADAAVGGIENLRRFS